MADRDERREDMKAFLAIQQQTNKSIVELNTTVKDVIKNLTTVDNRVKKMDTQLFNHGMGYIQKFECSDKNLADEQAEIKKSMKDGFENIVISFKKEMKALIDDVIKPIKKQVGKNKTGVTKINIYFIAVGSVLAAIMLILGLTGKLKGVL